MTSRSPATGAGSLSSVKSGAAAGSIGDQEGERRAAFQALGNGDAIVRDVADAFRVRAVAMRRKRQDLAIAAAAFTHVAHKVAGDERPDGRRRRFKAGRLRTPEIERNRDREGL